VHAEDPDLLKAEALMKVVRAVLDAEELAIDALTVAASPSGQVALYGLTNSAEARDRAVEIVWSVPDVTQVSCGIMVL
jgi:osmotically-inducible protein OsmY